MDEGTLEIYKRYIPDLTPAEGGYHVGRCPLCGEEDSFLAGPRSAATGELTNDFVCLGCEREGSPGDLIRALGVSKAEPEQSVRAENLLNSVGKIFPETEEEEPEKREERSQVSSDMKMEEILSSILKMDLPGRELRIFLLLYLSSDGLTAKEISEKLQISQSNIHRYLATVEKKGLIYSTGKPKRYFKTEDAERQT